MADSKQTYLVNIDYVTFCLYLALVATGGIFIYSVEILQSGTPTGIADFLMRTQAGKQVIWIVICLLIFGVIVLLIDHKIWHTFAYLFYGGGLLALFLVLFLGNTINGATSWFSFSGFSFQPSELAKVGTCLAVASFLNHWNTNLTHLRSAVLSIALFAAPIVLVMFQPDAGSALVFLSFFVVLFREGFSSLIYIIGFLSAAALLLGIIVAPIFVVISLAWLVMLIYAATQRFFALRWILGVFMIGIGLVILVMNEYTIVALVSSLALGAAMTFRQFLEGKGQMIPFMTVAFLWTSALTFGSNYAFNNVLKGYQQQRINVWLQPDVAREKDPDSSFNLDRSKLAIGAGGLVGQGLFVGRLTKGRWVPEQNTDFIFSAIGEQQGFLGSAAVIILFLMLILRITMIAERQKTTFNRAYAYGVAGILFIHVFVNIGMTMGIVPVIGIPLPFISKGGSSLLGFTILLAILLKLDKHRGRIKKVRI